MLAAMKQFDFDVAIIGGGSGGYAAARTATAAGLRAAVIEGGKEIGGLCILRGCMPTKALLYAAEVKHLAEHPQAWGIEPGRVGFDFAKVMARKDAMVADFADCRTKQLTAGKFKFIRAMAAFKDPHTLELSTGKTLTARNFVISTGSMIPPPPFDFLRNIGCITSDNALSLTKLPKSLIILGGGAVAVEFAQFLARFGVKVTMIQRSAQLLKDFDADAAAVAQQVFERGGIKVFTETKLTGASAKGGLKRITFRHKGRKKTVAAEEVLNALGRAPNTASLNLGRAGVKTENGFVLTDAGMRTSARHIYAAGDCTGRHDIVHIAVMQGETAAYNLMHPRAPRKMDDRLLVAVVFTEPQIAIAGLTEKEAQARKVPYLAASYPFDDHGKSLIMEARDGFVKLLADPKSGEIIGGCCAGPQGGELIHEIVAAMQKRMTVKELAAMPHYHPTLAEIWTYPAEELAEKIAAQAAKKR
jgi:pyruvate/2-oxoglutarate dehydrogenase complex dihydrolipoamide dehydrogenase (E3) component